MLLLFADVLKSVSLCTSLPQDSLLGLLSTGEGGELPTSVGAERAGMFVIYCCSIQQYQLLFMRRKTKATDKALQPSNKTSSNKHISHAFKVLFVTESEGGRTSLFDGSDLLF